jgi:hypothetical protein
MSRWTDALRRDPLPWLVEESDPAVRHLALRDLLDRPAGDPEMADARKAAMAADPIASILAAQAPEGWWVKPGPGYLPKYSSTVWSVVFLDQMGADGTDARVRLGCEYVLDHTQASNGGLAVGGISSGAVHCLNGNLLRALVGFGMLDDERVQRALAWEAAAVTGQGIDRWYAVTPGPGFRCGANYGEPCAWGAVKAVLALARVPADRRGPAVASALADGVEFLLSRDPSVADYPMPPGNSKPNGSWFKLGFPLGYVADVLQVLEALCEAGAAADPRLGNAVEWLLGQQDAEGRWPNRYAYQGKMARDVDVQGRPSKWVTLRACRVLKAVTEARAGA